MMNTVEIQSETQNKMFVKIPIYLQNQKQARTASRGRFMATET